MSLTESIVEDAALKWFGELGYAVKHGPDIAPGELAAERDEFSEVLLRVRLHDALRREFNRAHGTQALNCRLGYHQTRTRGVAR